MTRRQDDCARKHRHASRQAAEAHLRSLDAAAARRGVADADRDRLAVYPCGRCGGYHVGHRKIGARA